MHKLVAPRDVFGSTLVEIGRVNERLFVVNADLSAATKTDKFSIEFPDRFINVGICEQNMAGVAAGLARVGFIPVMSTFACFAPGRCYDQIRQSIAYTNLNVKIASTHPGLAVGVDGATHQSLDDLALMRALPNMTVLAPSDQVQTRKAVLKAVEHEGPVYLRIGRMECPVFFGEEMEFEIGKAYVLREGTDVTLIAHGSMVGVIYEAAQILAEKGIQARVIDMPSIKPLDREAIRQAAEETKAIVTAEDHFLYGGLYSAVCEVVAGLVPVRGVAVRDRFGESGTAAELYEKYGLTSDNVVAEVFHALA
ncbi:MAG: transketolase family protein [Firmicutes bacterium]|nr:transketolase family protein [Bacillota bacterium]